MVKVLLKVDYYGFKAGNHTLPSSVVSVMLKDIKAGDIWVM